MTHSHSDIQHRTGARHLAVGLFAVLAVLLPTLSIFGALITTDRYIVREEEPVTEDQYVTSTSALVEGTLDGDLTVFSGSLTVTGTVTGNITVFSAGSVIVEESGSVGGSLNGAATSVTIRGIVGTDVFVAAGSTVVEETGSVGRDLMGFGGTVRIDGSVGRDVRGRAYRTTVDGTVSGDVDVATQSLGIAATAVVGGDVLYRSASEASIADGATIGGTVTQLPAQSNFLYGIVLAIANIVGFLGFIVAGLVVLWLARSTGSRAVGSVLTKPLRSFLVGLATVIALPVVIGLLAITLVGIPLAIILGAIGIILFIVGAVPTVTALGHLVLVKRGGLFGAFLVGAVLWRLSIFIPWVGPFLFLIALVWGVGAWVLGVIAARRADPLPPALVPAALVARGERTPDWEPPLAPGTEAAALAASVDDAHDPANDVGADEDMDEGTEDDEPPIAEQTDAEQTDSQPTDTEQSEAEDVAPTGDDGGFGFRTDDDVDETASAPDSESMDDASGTGTPPEVVGDRVTFGSAVVAGAVVASDREGSDEAAEHVPVPEEFDAGETALGDGEPSDHVADGADHPVDGDVGVGAIIDERTEDTSPDVPPVMDEPVAQDELSDQPYPDELAADEPVADESAEEELAAGDPVVDEPADDEPADDELGTDESAESEPATHAPAEGESANPDTEDLSGLTLSERFAALREELLTTGTVDPVEQDEDGSGASDDEPPSTDWGIKG